MLLDFLGEELLATADKAKTFPDMRKAIARMFLLHPYFLSESATSKHYIVIGTLVGYDVRYRSDIDVNESVCVRDGKRHNAANKAESMLQDVLVRLNKYDSIVAAHTKVGTCTQGETKFVQCAKYRPEQKDIRATLATDTSSNRSSRSSRK